VSGESRFDRVAATYDAIRPGYPDAVFDAVRDYGRFSSAPRGVEVGVGTGQATAQMAARRWPVVGFEPGANLAATARERLAPFDGVEIVTSSFEAAELEPAGFDLVAAATAWHWVDPVIGYEKAARVLRRPGVIALWWNAHVPDTDDVGWVPIRRVYADVAPELAVLARLTPDRPDYDPVAELGGCGWFGAVERHVFPFSVDYTTDGFLALLDTYASHQRLAGARRLELYEQLTRAIDAELGGTVTKPYEALLVLGRLVGSGHA
jgi:SAM-dependent methyltransferase